MKFRKRVLYTESRRLWFRKTRLPLYLIILSAFITIQWLIIVHLPKFTGNSQGALSKHRAILSKTHRLRYQVKMLSFKFTIREHVKAITVHQEYQDEITKRRTILEDGNQLNKEKWPVVISVGCSQKNLVYFLESFREGLLDSKISVICIFALNCEEATTHQEAMSTMIDDFEVCFNKVIWNITEWSSHIDLNFGKRHPRIEQLQKSKLQWWNVMNGIFRDGIEEGVLFNGILKDFTRDILFVDSNILLSRDFLQVATYASKIKSTMPRIAQLSLGIWGGLNLINAHPNTFAIRQSRGLHALVYGMNQSNWETLREVRQDFLEDHNPEWTLSLGDALSKNAGGFGVQTIVPTLSRYWLITSSNVNTPSQVIDSENSLARPSFPPWLLSPRLINTSYSSVNDGIRDSLGFLCNKAHTLNDGSTKNIICYCSFWMWKNTENPSFPRCFPEAKDDCLDSY